MFEGAPSSSSNPDAKIDLPPGLVLSTRLDTEIRSERALVGDRIAATVDQDAKWKGEPIVPSRLDAHGGRIRSIEKPADPSGNCTIALEFSELQIGNRRVRFFARLSRGEVDVERSAQSNRWGSAWCERVANPGRSLPPFAGTSPDLENACPIESVASLNPTVWIGQAESS